MAIAWDRPRPLTFSAPVRAKRVNLQDSVLNKMGN